MGDERRKKRQQDKAHVELLSDVSETVIPKDDHSTDETTLSLTPSEDRFVRANNDDFMNAENMRRNGWCNADGTPWMVARPKDEAALLRRGLVNMHGNRVPSTAPPRVTGYFDEVELLKKGLVNKGGEQRPLPSAAVQGSRESSEDVRHNFVYGHYGVAKDPSVENYITDAEVNTRGYKDRMGRVFYAIPLLDEPKDKGLKSCNGAIPRGVIVTNDRSEHSIRDYNPNIRTTSSEPVAIETAEDKSEIVEIPNIEPPKGSHVIECEVGKGADSGHLKYFVEKDGRTYYLQGPQNKKVFLEFNKKGASLISTCSLKSKPKRTLSSAKTKSRNVDSNNILRT